MPASLATYLDTNSGAPLRPEVLKVLRSFLQKDDVLLANPSSVHSFGRGARSYIDQSKSAILGTFTDRPQLWDVTFCSSGTDANQTAIRSALEGCFLRGEDVHWVTSEVEHSCVRRMAQWVKEKGGNVSFMPVEKSGRIAVEKLEELIQPGKTKLVSLIWVGNETGLTSHILGAKKLIPPTCRLHIDAVAGWGKVEADLDEWGADYVALSAHKVGALSGVGALIHRKTTVLNNPFPGSQQNGNRGGAENILGIVALGAAANTIPLQIQEEVEIGKLRGRFEQWLESEIPEIIINGKDQESHRVGHLLNITFPGFKKNLSLVTALDLAGFAVSSGSACTSGAPEPSTVLLAMGYSRIDAMNSLRLSMHSHLKWEEYLQLGHELKRIITKAQMAV